MKNDFLNWLNQSGRPFLIAGPCSAESARQVLETAQGIAQHYPKALYRAGVWKPRTRPGSFEGAGVSAFAWLKAMREQTGLRFMVEVATPQHIEIALKHQADALWIGARTVVNPFSVQELAHAMKGVSHIPILIKNPVHPDINLWIGAIERIQQAGVNLVAAIHRGFHKYSNGDFRNNPAWDIPIQLKTQLPHLPLFCDPSHITGNKKLIPYITQLAIDLAMDGLMIETHHLPAKALSDAQQQITPAELHQLISNIRVSQSEEESERKCEEINILRNKIDIIDDELVNLLAQRMALSKEIGQYKFEHNIAILQLSRWKKTLQSQIQNGKTTGLSENFIKAIYQIIHDESITVQSRFGNENPETKGKN